jgi:hypothetical protein
MNAPAKCPARAALAYVLSLTRENQRFPLAEPVLRSVHANAVRRLLEDGRYLAMVVGGDGEKAYAPRIALTIAGTYEVEGEVALEEAQGLARVHDKLMLAFRQKRFTKSLRLKWLHAQLAGDIELLDFRRWATMLCSPRLQGRYLHDRHGFCGQADAVGRMSNFGLFTHVQIFASFADWPLPKPQTRRLFLLDENGIRVAVDHEHERVHVFVGLAEIADLEAKQGPLAFEALVTRPGKRLHSLDLQMYGSSLGRLDDQPRCDPDDLVDTLVEFEIDFDANVCDSTELERLAAVVRRLEVLRALTRSEEELPGWATSPATRLKNVISDLRAELVVGPLKADSPLIKNAARVVRTALENALGDPKLAAFRDDFELGEWVTYRPTR